MQPVVPAYTVRNSLKEKDADGEKKEEKEEKKERERNNSAHQKPPLQRGRTRSWSASSQQYAETRFIKITIKKKK